MEESLRLKEVLKMRMRDRLLIYHPEFIKEDSCGGAFGCPSWYGFERNPPTWCKIEEKTCKKCWARKYEEPPKPTEETW